MMRKSVLLLASGVWLLSGAVTLAQFPKLVTDFEGLGGPADEYFLEVMFRDPQVSGSTTGILTGTADLHDSYWSPADGFTIVHSPNHASATVWEWTRAANHTAYVRLITSGTAVLPNPALHLQGKVRFWAAAQAWTAPDFATLVPNGNLFLGISIRETGEGVHQGGNGGAGGDVEFAALDARLLEIVAGTNGICETTADPNSDDVQLIALGTSGLAPDAACVSAGEDGVMQTGAGGDDGLFSTPRGMYSIPTDGVMRQYVFDLPALEAAGTVYPLTGDGTFGATPNNRGTLEALLITNDPANGAVGAKVILVSIDDVEFEAPIIDPPSIRAEPEPPRPLDESVMVDFVDPAASLVEVFRLENDGSETLLGSLAPGGNTEVEVPTPPMAANTRIVARQTIGADVSDNSTPVVVSSAGNAPLRIAMAIRETDQYDHNLPCGANGTGFDSDQPSTLEFIGASGQTSGFGIPDAPRFTPQLDWFEIEFNPCDEEFGVAQFSGNGELNLNPAPNFTMGVWEGLYFRIDAEQPAVGPYTVYIDDVLVKDSSGSIVCLVDDFESYTPGVRIVERGANGNGTADTVAEPTDVQVRPVGSSVTAGQIIVAPGADGTLETEPQGDDVITYFRARFNLPSVAGTSNGLASAPDVTAVTDEYAFSGNQSLRIEWGFLEASNIRSHLRLTTNEPEVLPETFVNPDSVIPFSLDGTLCDGTGDLIYSVMVRLAPADVPGDCDFDGDVDLADVGCLQMCFGSDPVSQDCEMFDIAPNGAPDGAVDAADFLLFEYLLIGPL